MIQRYTRTAIVLHWAIALLVLLNIALAWSWPNFLPDAQVRPAIDLHKSVGVTILGLALLRLLWRFGHRPPPFPRGYARWEVNAAHATHFLLYAILFAMPLTGWIMDSAYEHAAATPMYWFGLFQWPRLGVIMNLDPVTKKSVHDTFGAAHELISYLVYALFFIHLVGALKHQWLDRTQELQRMWPGRR
ncbi:MULTISPECIES: cytochrome b [unclassified Sphingomonas]|uniref:cytochrome b n=1 Tax=unclassified Sphingomonas TaxID=196159 RepID=UPI001F5A1AFC|nr:MULTISPECIES: cytochrome b [unclassified Sphingomonas]